MRSLLCLLLPALVSSSFYSHHLRRNRVDSNTARDIKLDFVGCPLNNDFYYNGTIYSPLWPAQYPPNDQCYYYMTAEIGKVISFEFPHYDVETCCDYVTIYDGAGMRNPILARFGGPNMTAPVPTGPVYSSTRYALVTFTSDNHIEQSGFQMNYKSVFTGTPCNRDILLVINGMSGVGSQDNFVKQLNFFADNLTTTWTVDLTKVRVMINLQQLNFFADNLTTTWTVDLTKVRVMINLQTDDDYALVYATTDLPNNQILSQTIHSLTDYVDNVLENNNTSVNSLFRYAEDTMSSLGTKEMAERTGIERVSIILISNNPNDDQDYYEAFEFGHKARTSDDSKIIVITVGNVDTSRLADLAQSASAAFHVDSFDALPTLVSSINTAICAQPSTSCGP